MKEAKDILSILTFSDKRKEILFLLQEEPRTLSDIKTYFDVKSPEILPRLKQMEAKNIIIRMDGIYRLTLLGEVLAAAYKPFLDTISAIETNEDFWRDHDLSAIPMNLLKRIKELKECSVISTKTCNIGESHEEFGDIVLKSKRIKGATGVFNPLWVDMFLNLAQKGVEIYLIVTENIYKVITNKYFSQLTDGLDCEKVHLYVTKSELKAAFVSTDQGISLSLFKNGTYDPYNDLMGFDSAAINWVKDLYEYYKENATEVKNILPMDEAVIQETYSQLLVI